MATATRRQASKPVRVEATLIRESSFLLLLFVGLGAAFAMPGFAHPTDEELLEAVEDRSRCTSALAPSERVDSAKLGMSAKELAKAVPGLQVDGQDGEEAAERAKHGMQRMVRSLEGDVASIEYEIWNGRVYKIRWRLAERFERPVIDTLGKRARTCLGLPEYDQKFEAEPGSADATRRQIGWDHGERRIELRQLHPLRGGPVYLSVADYPVMREIVSNRVVLYPDPEKTGPWWERSMSPLRTAKDEERKQLGDAFVELLGQLDH